jgi:hypothetical protein
MNIKAEISRRHYHPGPESHPDLMAGLTKRNDLSVPPYWAANEKIEKDGKLYTIVMPARAKELFEDDQEAHLHVPKSFRGTNTYLEGVINGQRMLFKVKREPYEFEPVAHFDEQTAEKNNIKPGDFVIIA